MASSFWFSSGLIAIFGILFLQIHPSQSLTCSSQKLSGNRLYDHCNDLPQLNSYLHWTYNSTKAYLNIAFLAPATANGWVAWAINPRGLSMVGSQALIAYNVLGKMTVQTFDVNSYDSIAPSKIAYDVWYKEAEYSNGTMTIFATIALPSTMTTINQVWEVGSSVSNGIPNVHSKHSSNLNSMGTLDLVTGVSGSSTGGFDKRKIHGLLNGVSWGFLFPLGVIFARYLKTFKSADPAWFYLHLSCQCSAYVIGVAGCATGLGLGSESEGGDSSSHGNIGIALFCFATLQIFALFLRPKKDHKYRIYWNVYHQSFGYMVVILGIINVFKGLELLDPAQIWKTAYIILVIVLAAIALVLEVITWSIVLNRKSKRSAKSYDGLEAVL